jgi:membrane protease YdiL (CAAX protease family)
VACIGAGWLVFVVALTLATMLGAAVEADFNDPLVRQGVQAVVVTGLVLPTIYALRRYGDGRSLRGLGLSSPTRGLPYFCLGVALVVAMAGVGLSAGVVLGWLRVVSVPVPAVTVLALLVNLPVAFLYEAFPEELVFRGYLYSSLSSRLARWLAMLAGVALFVLAPLAVSGAQAAVGMEPGNSVTVDYVVVLIGFGIVLQLCRIVSGSLWTGIGFHPAWLEISRYVVAPWAAPLVRIEDPVPGTGELLVLFVGAILVSCLVLVFWPRLRKRPVGWRERDPAESPDETLFVA